MAYVTLEETKEYLQVTTTASDSLIETYIEIVTDEVDTYTDRVLSLTTHSKVLNYKESMEDRSTYRPYNIAVDYPRLYLDEYPVVDGTVVLTYDNTTTVSTDNYKVDNDTGVVFVYNYQQDDERKLVGTYVAGYTSTNAPAALKGVVYQGVKSYYENNGTSSQGGGNVKSKSLKDFSVTYGNEQDSLLTRGADGALVKTYLASNESTLQKYCRVII
jgi:hypothetical protein